jgi:asparagine synthase (glutamine-hydrolysing)
VTQRPKRGFSPPVGEWHRALFSAYGEDLIDGYLCEHHVLRRECARKLSAGPFPAGAITPLSFKALVLEHWCRQMLN